MVGEVHWRQTKRRIKLTTCAAVPVTTRAHGGGSGAVPERRREGGGHARSIEQLLKSHLQKCVRRSLAGLAVGSALQLMRANMPELLQRLGVVLIEDVTLFAGFPTLVWLMAAALKGLVRELYYACSAVVPSHTPNLLTFEPPPHFSTTTFFILMLTSF